MATFFCPQAKVAVVERFNCNFPSLGPGSALWEKGEKIGVGEKKKKKSASEASREVVWVRRPFPLPRIPLRSPIFDPVFLPFPPLQSLVPGIYSRFQASDRSDGAKTEMWAEKK